MPEVSLSCALAIKSKVGLEGKDYNFHVDKIWIIVYDQIFVPYIVSERTTLLIPNGEEQIHIRAVERISQDYCRSYEYWVEDSVLPLLSSSFEHFKEALLYDKKCTFWWTLDNCEIQRFFKNKRFDDWR